MNLLGFSQENRASFEATLQGLIDERGVKAEDLFLNVVESQQEAEMNYWMMKILLEKYSQDPQQVLGQDAAGQDVSVLQAAALMNNLGVIAALLETNSFAAQDLEVLQIAQIASNQQNEPLLGLVLAFAKEKDYLEVLVRSLKDETLQ